jgi:N-terminal domain of (some) glycogen debranching enzymes
VGDASSLAGEGSPTDRVTLVEGSAFVISSPNGDLVPGTAEGFFFRDTRFLSRLELRVNGQRPEALARSTPEPFCGTFVGRIPPRPGLADSTLMVIRTRYIGRGMRDDVVIRNLTRRPTAASS